jgi:hypothetical protein
VLVATAIAAYQDPHICAVAVVWPAMSVAGAACLLLAATDEISFVTQGAFHVPAATGVMFGAGSACAMVGFLLRSRGRGPSVMGLPTAHAVQPTEARSRAPLPAVFVFTSAFTRAP